MILKTIMVSFVETNCYIYADEISKDAICIDPGGDFHKIERVINENGFNLKYIILTHCHYDHIGAVKDLKDAFSCKTAIHEDDADGLFDPRTNLSAFVRSEVKPSRADILLKDGQKLNIFGRELLFIHTPGHTMGGICILDGNILFSGDSLFKHEIGRCDLPGGNYNSLINSLKQKIICLSGDILVYPGHGEPTTIKDEKLYNAYLK